MRTPEKMKRLYERLKDFGIQRSYALAVALPSGWDDSETENPTVYSQALGLLSRNLNISLRSLQDDTASLEWQECVIPLFKHNRTVNHDQLTTAKCLAVRAAQVACEALKNPVQKLPDTAVEIRNNILSKHHPYVSFESLLDFCWDSGIPVLHVSNLPQKNYKPEALACIINGQPVIVIFKRHKYSAWLLFILAHELGHIVMKHLEGNSVLFDEKIKQNDSEDVEAEANTFAVELITGKPDIRYVAQFNLNADQLYEAAMSTSKRDKVDPGFVALNYADTKGHYAVGNLALSKIETDTNPIDAIHDRMCERIDWDEIGRDSRHFLRRISEMAVR